MMNLNKFLAFAAFFIFSMSASAQCYIDGSPTVYVGETQTYTVKNNKAKCVDCHEWSFAGENIKLKESKEVSLQITGMTAGTAMIFLKMETPNGEVRCNKNLSILPAVVKQNVDCDVFYSGFSEKKLTENKIGFMHKKSDAYQYLWTATYADGQTQTSRDAEPQFNLTKENHLAKISVQILSAQCMRTYTKTYEQNFWAFF